MVLATRSGFLLSDVLGRLCINLQLRDDQFEKATQSYRT